MRKIILVIGIILATFVTSCKKKTLNLDNGDCFYFEAVDAGSVVCMVNETNSGETLNVNLQYSTDKSKWSPFVVGETSVTLANVGDRVYIRADGTNNTFFSSGNGISHNYFTATGKVKVGGNIMFLLDGTGTMSDFDTLLNYGAFGWLFKEMVSLTDASSLVLPATTLAYGCYVGMFNACKSLITAPELPATKLAYGCYSFMFSYCTSLTSAPKLPATTLAENCYDDMFNGCTSLTIAPELPATTLAGWCYYCMFYGCASLTTAPELPATTLSYLCYRSMFYGCASLTASPKLPATTLAEECYTGMFNGCTSLTTAPELPATVLTNLCYCGMFADCTSLTVAPKLPATTLAEECYEEMFQNCSSLTTAPELPATTLAENCYGQMFSGCTSLTNSPELPAITLAKGCYREMFYGCSSLQSINVSFTDWNDSENSTYIWLQGVSPTGTFKCPTGLNVSKRDESHIPEGWTIEIK